MKRFLLILAFIGACALTTHAQESEYSGGGGGTAGAITAGVGSGNAGRVPQFASTTSLVDSKMLTSGTNSGTWTLYDSGGTGISSLVVRAGSSQSTNPFFQVFANDGATSVFTVTADSGGVVLTGTADLHFAAGGTTPSWKVESATGNFEPYADNTYDIGTSGARVADIFAGRLSVYDTTVTTGVSQVSIREGAGQGSTKEFEVLDNAGTARFGFHIPNYTFFVGGTDRIRIFGDGSNAIVFPTGGHVYSDSYDPVGFSNPVLMRGSTKTLTDGAATDFVTIPISNNTAVAGIIEYTVVFSTGGNIEVESGEIHFGGTNEAGTELADVSELGTPLQVPTTTMTVDFAVTTGTDNMTISCDADSTALAVNPVITYRVRFNSGVGSYTVP